MRAGIQPEGAFERLGLRAGLVPEPLFETYVAMMAARTVMAGRVRHEVGDVFEADLGEGWDLVTANSIVHHLEPERAVALLARAREALRPGGSASVLQLERAAGNQLGALTGMLFFIISRARTYTAGELRGFFEAAGYERVRARRHRLLPGNVLVTGRAPRR
ncbi:MAG: class I SAM-dependent methyltransferase [Thermoleophilaceae bacterium]